MMMDRTQSQIRDVRTRSRAHDGEDPDPVRVYAYQNREWPISLNNIILSFTQSFSHGSLVMATSSFESSGSLEHVDAFSDRGDSENCRLLNTTVDTAINRLSSANELLDGKRYTITYIWQV